MIVDFFSETIPYIDYFQQVSQNPSTKDKEALLKKIKVNGANSYRNARSLMISLSRRSQDVWIMIQVACQAGLHPVVNDCE